MPAYIDGFVLPIRKDKIDAYRAMAETAAVVWRDHGALSYRECVGENLDTPFGMPFPKQLQLSPEETVVFAWIEYPSTSRASTPPAHVAPRDLSSTHRGAFQFFASFRSSHEEARHRYLAAPAYQG